jgi:hypothetical protein
MITEGIKNVSQSFKNKFSRDNVSTIVNDPRNATRQMTPGKGSDPSKFMNIRPKKDVFTKLTKSVDSAFYTKVTAGQRPRLKKGDTLADVPAKLFNLIKKNQDDKRIHFELYRDIDRPAEIKDETNRHKELVEALNKRRKQTEEIEEATRKAKQEYEKSKAEADKVIKDAKEKAKESTETVPTPPAAAPTPPAATPTPPAATPTPPAATPTTTVTTPVTTKPVETATKQGTVPIKEAPSAKPVEPVTTVSPSVTPSITPAPKTLITPSTAVKVGAGALAASGISSAAALSIERETGKPASQAIENVGQIVQNDPNPGASSYGIFGINSQGSVQSFVRENPQFELTAKPATKEFDEQWTKISKDKPKEMLQAQLTWYDKHVTKQLNKDLSKLVPSNFANNPKIITYLSDRRVQYGPVMEKQAIEYASNAKTPEEFISLITEYDLAHLKEAFPKYLKTHPGDIKGLQNRLKEREKVSLNTTTIETGNQLAQSSIQNNNMKQNERNTILIDNTQTNIIGGGNNKPKQIISQPSPQDLPMFQQVGP